MKKFNLKNGMVSLFYPVDTAYSVTMSLNVNAGVVSECASNYGITHFLEHLHFRRLNTMTQNELYYKMDKMGGNLNASTYKEMLRFYIKVRPHYIFEALSFFEEIILADNWSNEDIEIEKNIVLNELAEKENYFDMKSLTDAVIFKGTLIEGPVLGTEKSINNLDRKSIVDYKKKIFSKENLCLVVTGKISDTDIDKINQRLEKIEIGEPLHKVFKKSSFGYGVEFFDYKFDHPYVTLSFYIKDNINYYAAVLLNSILGGGTGAVLQREIRETRGLSYDIYSYLDCFSELSTINISFSASEDNICLCIQIIIAVLEKLKQIVSMTDYETNIPYFTENLWYMLEDTTVLNEELSWEVFREDCPKTVEERIEAYKEVSLPELSAVVQEVFYPENCKAVIAGDLKNKTKQKIKSCLKNWNNKGQMGTHIF